MPRLFFACVVGVHLAILSCAQDASGLYRQTKSAILTVETDQGVGTGFVVGDGKTIFTCAHVVSGATRVSVEGFQSESASIEYIDETRDVAILRVAKRFPRILAFRSKTPDPGTRVYVIGSALGIYDKTITEGLVSGIRRAGDASLLQISASITHGNSGSPVLDAQGEVVGMAQSYFDGTSVGFALSAYDLKGALTAERHSAYEQDNPISDLRVNSSDPEAVGYLGKAKKPSQIHEHPSWKSRILSKVSAGQYLVIRESADPSWVRILLNRGSFGYLPTGVVAKLPYTLTRKNAGPFIDAAKVPLLRKVWTSLIGAPFKKGSRDKNVGFGNSEFVVEVFSSQGQPLPLDLDVQSQIGKSIPRLEFLLPGDRLYFYDERSEKINLAGIYDGDGNFVISDPQEGKVCIHFLDEKWRKLLVAARR